MAAGRAALLTSSQADHLHVLQQYAVYQRTHLQIFADSLSDIFLSLRSGPQHHDPDAPVMIE